MQTTSVALQANIGVARHGALTLLTQKNNEEFL